nr:MAG TPA: hypothetical protein [Caudoviricetes sp.]
MKAIMTVIAIAVLALSIETFGYARKTYEIITDGNQYSELKVITEGIEHSVGSFIEKRAVEKPSE